MKLPNDLGLYKKLKRSAREATAFRGHILHPIRRTNNYPGETAYHGAAKCRTCPAWVQVNTRPQPNGIDIGGPAVAMTCPTDKKWC
jgi:hypothetical protein